MGILCRERFRLLRYLYKISGLSYVNLQNWSIGIFKGASPFNLVPINNNSNPVLTASDVTDVPAVFVADPFMIKDNSTWYMFFEVYNSTVNLGEIAYATSNDGISWNYEKTIIKGKFHLSYPYVFKWNDEYYMMPETHPDIGIRLYKAINFPTNWVYYNNIIDGFYSDPSVLYYRNKWWLFTSEGGSNDTLLVFYSDNLLGPWTQHPKSPIIKGNPHIARPAGRVVLFEGRIFRYAQDDYPEYGRQVYAFEINELTTTTYHEKIVSEEAILKPSGTGWNALGMHNIDPVQIGENQWIACVDGWGGYVKVRYSPIKKRLLKLFSS
jgi:hypothetical protein